MQAFILQKILQNQINIFMELVVEMDVHYITINHAIYVQGNKKLTFWIIYLNEAVLDKCYYVVFVLDDHFYNSVHRN